MTDDYDPDSTDDHPEPPTDPESTDETASHPLLAGDRSVGSALDEFFVELGSKPRLWLPFFVVGCLLTAAGYLRERDPLPVDPSVSESTVDVSYTIYPTGRAETARSLDAFVDLPLEFLVYAVGLELVVVVATATAGWLTMTRVSEVPFRPRRFLVYLGGIAGLSVLARSGTVLNLEYAPGSFVGGLAAVILLAFVAVRLFLLPAAILHEAGLLAAFRASWHRSRSHGAVLFGLIVGFSLASQWLAEVPLVGVVLSSTIVGTSHAVALAILYERYGESTGSRRTGLSETDWTDS